MSVDAPTRSLSAVDLPPSRTRSTGEVLGRVWSAAWPKLIALAVVLAAWQLVVASGWRPSYVLPGPLAVAASLGDKITSGAIFTELAVTMRRAAVGFALACAVGTAVGVAVSQWRPLRLAIGSLITGIQTMPSIAWFPLAILLFQLSEQAITFVVILGAAPSIANGILSGIDHIPPSLLRAGRVMGARGVDRYRFVVLPAALPAYVAGLSQGWAFAWRSLMAGELLVIIAQRPSLGVDLQFSQEQADSAGLIAVMVVILAVGMVMDGFFASISKRLRARRGLAVD